MCLQCFDMNGMFFSSTINYARHNLSLQDSDDDQYYPGDVFFLISQIVLNFFQFAVTPHFQAKVKTLYLAQLTKHMKIYIL